ncbi:MAG: hypothetical protein CL908_15105 [Deltaproteobacteria bacterium]|nr:hypothetical protein [Deltaproteobacteria bacterium]
MRCPNWLGDVVMATPGLRALREARPEAEIVAQLPAPLAPLLAGSGLCDALWPVTPRASGLGAMRRDAKRIAAHRFDLGIAIPESISSALLMRWGRVRHSIGFARDPVRRWLLDEVVQAPAQSGRRRLVSRERFVLQLMAAAGSSAGDTRLHLRVTPEEEARLDVVLSRRGASLEGLRGAPPIVIAPGAGFGESKCWPVESFAALADRLVARGRSVVVLGAPGEGPRLGALKRAMRSECLILDGVLDVGAVKALLRVARALVSNDAGARHVAAAFAVQSVVFFGPTSVAKTADNLAAIEVLETEHACRPCYRRRCPVDHRCLRSIAVDEAESALDRALERAEGAVFAPSVRGGRA